MKEQKDKILTVRVSESQLKMLKNFAKENGITVSSIFNDFIEDIAETQKIYQCQVDKKNSLKSIQEDIKEAIRDVVREEVQNENKIQSNRYFKSLYKIGVAAQTNTFLQQYIIDDVRELYEMSGPELTEIMKLAKEKAIKEMNKSFESYIEKQ